VNPLFSQPTVHSYDSSKGVIMSRVVVLAAFLSLAPLAAFAQATPSARSGMAGPLPPGVTVVASGLTNPQGFTWDEDGALYVALPGVGGDTEGVWINGPSGNFGGYTGSVARIEAGCAIPVAEGLPSSVWAEADYVWGVSDVAFLNGQLYALINAGPDWGTPDDVSGVYRIDNGTTELVADLSSWFEDVPPDFVAPDYNSDGSLFDMEAGDDALWVVESVGGRLLRVSPDGEIALVADLSIDHPVPDALVLAPDGGAYVGYLMTHPYTDGLAKVVHVAADGTVTDAWTGLTTVTGLALGPDGTLYAVEMSTENRAEPPNLQPHTGRVVRQTGLATSETVVSEGNLLTKIGFGPDDALYLTYPAYGPDAGRGQGVLLRIDLSTESPVSLADLGEREATCVDEAGR
jgi:sugar lactone lactonase YvrE